jgi:hypothetical protein
MVGDTKPDIFETQPTGVPQFPAWTRLGTVTFQLRYCFFVIEYGHRKMLCSTFYRNPKTNSELPLLTATYCLPSTE